MRTSFTESPCRASSSDFHVIRCPGFTTVISVTLPVALPPKPVLAFNKITSPIEICFRSQKAYRLGGFWCTLANSGQQKLFDYVFEYLSIAGQEIAQMMAESVSRSSEQAILDALDNAESAECDEVFLVPATAEIQEIERLSNLVIRR